MQRNFTLLIAFTFSLLSALSLKAQWGNSADSMVIINGSSFGGGYTPFVFCSDGNNGVITAWVDGTHIDAQRVDANGYLKWGANGILVYDSTGTQLNLKITTDGHGGCYVAWVSYSVVGGFAHYSYLVQRIDSNGNELWLHDGLQVVFPAPNTFSATNLSILDNNGTGAFMGLEVGWSGGAGSVRAAKIDLNGKPLWDSTGVAVTPVADYRNPKLILDGYGGMEMIYFSDVSTAGNIKIQRLDSAGNLRWGANAVGLNTLFGITDGVYNLSHTNSDNIVATWDGYLYNSGIYAQKLDTAGNFLWGAHEVFVCDTPANQTYPDVISDGMGGAYFAWTDSRTAGQPARIYAQRLNGGGAEQWPHNGIAADTLNTYNPNPSLAPDVNNGVRIFWPSINGTNHVNMQRFDTSGNAVCSQLGVRVTPANTQTILYGNRSVQHLNNGGDIVLGYNNFGLYAQYVPAGCNFPPPYHACDSVQSNFGLTGVANAYQFTDSSVVNSGTVQSWYWDFGDTLSGISDTSSLQNPAHVFSSAGTYTVCLTVTGGIPNNTCNNVYCRSVTILSTQIGIINLSGFYIYPNPVKDNFTLSISDMKEAKAALSITDVYGRIINVLSVKNGSNPIEASYLSSGAYLLTVHSTNGDMLYQQKVLVVK